MSEITQNLISMMEERVEALKTKGDWEGALNAAKTTVETAKENYQLEPSSHKEYAQALEILGDVLYEKNDIQLSLESYSEIIDLLEGQAGCSHILGRVGAKLAIIYEDQEMFDEAKSYYKWAIERLEAASIPSPLDVAGICNNLAFIYERENRLPEAEGLFLKALKINREENVGNDESTADIWNNLGGLLYKSRKYSQALEMHKMALDVRSEILGADHVDTAQSLGNLALVYGAQGDLNAARESFEKALKILESSHQADISIYSTISANFAHVLEQDGLQKEAEAVKKRISKFVKKH